MYYANYVRVILKQKLVSFSSSDITPEKQETTKVRNIIGIINIIVIIDIIY